MTLTPLMQGQSMDSEVCQKNGDPLWTELDYGLKYDLGHYIFRF